jgi:hypothetical protein
MSFAGRTRNLQSAGVNSCCSCTGYAEVACFNLLRCCMCMSQVNAAAAGSHAASSCRHYCSIMHEQTAASSCFLLRADSAAVSR